MTLLVVVRPKQQTNIVRERGYAHLGIHKHELFVVRHASTDNNNSSKEKGSEEMTECCPGGSESDPNLTPDPFLCFLTAPLSSASKPQVFKQHSECPRQQKDAAKMTNRDEKKKGKAQQQFLTSRNTNG